MLELLPVQAVLIHKVSNLLQCLHKGGANVSINFRGVFFHLGDLQFTHRFNE